jgi:outer membrane protein TolC
MVTMTGSTFGSLEFTDYLNIQLGTLEAPGLTGCDHNIIWSLLSHATGSSMPSLRPYAVLMSASLIAGCAVGPDYQRPDAPLSDRFLGRPAVEQRSETAQASLAVWWEGFADPTLSAFITQALAQNLDLAQASARVAQARAGLGAANAALLPSGAVNGQAARAYQSVETPQGQLLDSMPGYDRYGNAYALNLEAGWEVDVFGGLRRGREAALAVYQAS